MLKKKCVTVKFWSRSCFHLSNYNFDRNLYISSDSFCYSCRKRLCFHVINNYFNSLGNSFIVNDRKINNLGLVFLEYLSCVGVKEGFLNCLANVLLFISGLCFGYCFAFFYLRRVVNDDIDSFFSEPLAKKTKNKKK